MFSEESKQSLPDQRQSNPIENDQNVESLFSPRFKSLAAMAGWDEESIIIASLIVEDTPDREFKHKKRSDLHFKTPPSASSRRKRRVQRKSPNSISIPVIRLDEEEPEKQENHKEKSEQKIVVKEEHKTKGNEFNKENSGVSCSNLVVPCMDKLREELSCAICLEICFEPSTTSCGHSFCKKCLRSAADKCGKKCPKCRQLISNGRSCTVNTVLWNTIQLLFPQEVEARKASGALNSREAERHARETRTDTNLRNRNIHPSGISMSSRDVTLRRRGVLNQDEDSALAQRPQREDLSRVLSRDSSGRSRRGAFSQEEDDELAQSLQRENLSRLLRRDASGRRRRGVPNQDEDAALALRLQREEFMEAFRGTAHEQSRSSLSLARANLRAMASRAINIRMRS